MSQRASRFRRVDNGLGKNGPRLFLQLDVSFLPCRFTFILGMVVIASVVGCSPAADKEVKQMDNDFDNGLPEIDAPPSDYTGVWIERWPSGAVSLRVEYVNGLEEGESIAYWEDGTVAQKGQMKNGQCVGEWIDYYPSGSIQCRGSYKDGEWDGERQYYYDQGGLSCTEEWRNGIQHGRCVQYTYDGEVLAEGFYVEGQKTFGTFFEFEDEENFTGRKLVTYEDGHPVSERWLDDEF